ncbi:hypothetical protein BJV78DRAFT_1188834 [Lactifluus subvellereus]|nr:hypothetical protein BJV78DRAFT_1188834 [Lactifluus subvellereus]
MNNCAALQCRENRHSQSTFGLENKTWELMLEEVRRPNDGSIVIAQNPQFHKQSKHIAI